MEPPPPAVTLQSYYLTTLLTVVMVPITPTPISSAPLTHAPSADVDSLQATVVGAAYIGHPIPTPSSSFIWTSTSANATSSLGVTWAATSSMAMDISVATPSPTPPSRSSSNSPQLSMPLVAVIPLIVIGSIYLTFILLASRCIRESFHKVRTAATVRKTIHESSASTLALPIAEEYASYRKRERERCRMQFEGVWGTPWIATAPEPGEGIEMQDDPSVATITTVSHRRQQSISSPPASPTVSRFARTPDRRGVKNRIPKPSSRANGADTPDLSDDPSSASQASPKEPKEATVVDVKGKGVLTPGISDSDNPTGLAGSNPGDVLDGGSCDPACTLLKLVSRM